MSPNVRVFNVLARLNLDSESDSILEAVLGENKNPLERVKDLLDIYGRCKLREGYWVSIFEALLTAQHAHARAIASSLCEELNLRRLTETIAIYPLVICGILNAGNRLDPLSSSGPGNRDWFCPSIIGRMVRHCAEGATTMHPTCSEDVKRQLSEAFLEYIRGTDRRALSVLRELNGRNVPDSVKKVFLELSHRLFGELSPSEQLAALSTAYTKKTADE